jgi:hypothetical protein
MANCQSPQFCSQIPPRGGHVGRLVHRFLPTICALGSGGRRLVGVGSAAWQARAPERAPADARQSLNRRRAKFPHTAPVERPWRCITARYTSNLSPVIGESAAIATQGRTRQWHSGLAWHSGSGQLLRRRFALPRWRSSGRPRPPLVLPVGTPPGTASNPSPLGPQPLSGRSGPERGAPPAPPRRGQKSVTSCSGRLLR